MSPSLQAGNISADIKFSEILLPSLHSGGGGHQMRALYRSLLDNPIQASVQMGDWIHKSHIPNSSANGCPVTPKTVSPENTFSFFAIWIGWLFLESSSPGSTFLNNSFFNLSLFSHFTISSKRKWPSLQHSAYKSPQINSQVHCLQVLLSTKH